MRAITSGELAILRAPHWAKIYAIIDRPVTVGACQVNQTFTNYSGVTDLIVDGWTTGTYAACLPGMTVLVGSGAGLADKGRCRLIEATSAGSLVIGMTSDILWADNLYLTIIDEFGFWAKPMMLMGETALSEGIIEYTDQHTAYDPVVVMGPDAVLWLTGATVAYNPSSAASWTLSGTITGIAWACTGATVTNGTTATPTITFNAAGRYNLTCTLTNSDGKSWTGRRNVYVVSAANPPDEIIVSNCYGDGEAGGWEATCTVLTATLQGLLRGGLKCILFTDNYKPGSTLAWEISNPGETAGTANILMAGWIDGESIRYTDDRREVEFGVKGPQHWLGQVTGNAVTLKDLTTDLTQTWLTIDDMTIRDVFWHWMHWRCTADMIIDVNVEALTQQVDFSNNSNGSIWEQLESIAQVMLMRVGCNRYGQFYAEREPQWILSTDRGSIPVLMAITDQDWLADGVTIRSDMITKYSMIDLSAKTYDGTAAVDIYSRAPGVSAGRYGGIAQVDGVYVEDQTGANALAALLFAHLNNQFGSITLELSHDNRFFDIVPMAYATISIPARAWGGAAFAQLSVIPRRVEQVIDGSKITTNLELEGVTSEAGYPAGVTVLPPAVVPNEPPGPGDGEGVIEPPPSTWFPPTITPGPIDGGCSDSTANGPYVLNWDKDFLDSLEEAYAWLPCKVRGGTFQSYVLNVPSQCALYAVNESKATVLTAESDGKFDPVSATDVAGFKIVAPEIIQGPSGPGYIYPSTLLAQGTFDINGYALPLDDMEVGSWYCVDFGGEPLTTRHNPSNLIINHSYDVGVFASDPRGYYGHGGNVVWVNPDLGTVWIQDSQDADTCVVTRLNNMPGNPRIYFKRMPLGSPYGLEFPQVRMIEYGNLPNNPTMTWKLYATSTTVPPKYVIPTGSSSLYNVCPHD